MATSVRQKALRENKSLHAQLQDWLRANGIDPRLVPANTDDEMVTVDGDVIRYPEALVADAEDLANTDPR